GQLASPNFQLRGAKQNIARRHQGLRGFRWAIEKAGLGRFGLHRVAREKDVTGLCCERRFHPGAQKLGAARLQDQSDGLLFRRLGEENARQQDQTLAKTQRKQPIHAFSASVPDSGFGARNTADVWIISGSVLPRTGTSARYSVPNWPFKSSRVASLRMS